MTRAFDGDAADDGRSGCAFAAKRVERLFDFLLAVGKLRLFAVARECEDVAAALFRVMHRALHVEPLALAADADAELGDVFPEDGVDDLPPLRANLPEQGFDHAGLGIVPAERGFDGEAAELVLALAGEDDADQGSRPSRSGASSSPLA
jgi:hypothetical protein